MISPRLTASICLLAWLPVILSCQESKENQADKVVKKQGFVRWGEIETREQDGLTYLKGEATPHTGVVVSRDGDWQMRHLANFEDGKQHGSEMWWHDNGRLKKMLDFEHGEKVRHREWFENGNRKIDAMMKEGAAFGRHRTWFEDGRPRFSGNFVENLKWDGHVKDIHEDGTVMWDAIFKRGHYVSGKYPPGEKQKLIERGMLKEDGSQGSEVKGEK